MLFTIYKDCFKTHLHKMSRFWYHFGRVAKNLLILSEWVFYNGCLLRKRRRFNIVANNLFLLQIINSLDNFWRWDFGNFQKFLEFHKVFRTPFFPWISIFNSHACSLSLSPSRFCSGTRFFSFFSPNFPFSSVKSRSSSCVFILGC